MVWRGRVRGFQKDYRIQVQWSWMSKGTPPFVFILDPVIRPRVGEAFVDLPHLIYNDDAPEKSALCLFDPDTGEWSDRLLIADTTIPGHPNGCTTTSFGTSPESGAGRTHLAQSRSERCVN